MGHHVDDEPRKQQDRVVKMETSVIQGLRKQQRQGAIGLRMMVGLAE